MSDDLAAVVAGAVEESRGGLVSDSEPSASEPSGDAGDSGEGSSEPVSPSSSAAPTAVPGPAPDDLDAELESFGFTRPVAGQREGTFKYAKVRKMQENRDKKLRDAHAAALQAQEVKLQQAQRDLDQNKVLEQLVRNDPERYLRTLAALHPAYQRFVDAAPQPGTGTRPGTEPTISDQAPKPDYQYADGSTGYSPEGLLALRQWDREQTKREVLAEVRKEYAARFGPIEQDWRMTRARQQFEVTTRPIVQAEIATAQKDWGSYFIKDDPAVLALMEQGVPFEAALRQTYLPKVLADRNTMRGEVLAEMNQRPAAASRITPGASGAIAAHEEESLSDTVRNAVNAARGRR